MSLFIVIVSLFLAVYIQATNANFNKYFDPYYIEYHVYRKGQSCNPDILTYNDYDALDHSNFKFKNDTIVYIHGWLETPQSESAQSVKNAILQHMDCNVILVDWREISMSFYFSDSGPNTIEVGNRIAQMMIWLEERNRINITNLHVIGFSLGAHIAGFMSKALNSHKVRRITGLDPAAPGFEGTSCEYRLDKSDAKFVDIIHTCTEFLGYRGAIGHADFYPNYGNYQPNCWSIDVSCSHQYAWRYYIESIENPKRFPAYKCDYQNMHVCNCRDHGITVMGHDAKPTVHGVFYTS